MTIAEFIWEVNQYLVFLTCADGCPLFHGMEWNGMACLIDGPAIIWPSASGSLNLQGLCPEPVATPQFLWQGQQAAHSLEVWAQQRSPLHLRIASLRPFSSLQEKVAKQISCPKDSVKCRFHFCFLKIGRVSSLIFCMLTSLALNHDKPKVRDTGRGWL